VRRRQYRRRCIRIVIYGPIVSVAGKSGDDAVERVVHGDIRDRIEARFDKRRKRCARWHEGRRRRNTLRVAGKNGVERSGPLCIRSPIARRIK
jgi:hypothetical protein